MEKSVENNKPNSYVTTYFFSFKFWSCISNLHNYHWERKKKKKDEQEINKNHTNKKSLDIENNMGDYKTVYIIKVLKCLVIKPNPINTDFARPLIITSFKNNIATF